MYAVIKVENEDLKKLENFYKPYIVKRPPYTIFMAKYGTLVITAYLSGKVLFQGNGAEDEARLWGTVEAKNKKEKYHLSNNDSIGSDEVGTGDYFGPVVVVASYIKREIISELKALNVRDSKKMSEKEIIKIGKTLKEIIPCSIKVITPFEYNEAIEIYKNSKIILAKAHNEVLTSMHEKYPEIPLEIDEFVNEETYNKYLNNQALKGISFLQKGEEKSYSIAVSAIIARFIFLEEWKRMEDEYNFNFNKGANDVLKNAKEFVQKFGKDKLKNVSKLHFKTTEEVFNQ